MTYLAFTLRVKIHLKKKEYNLILNARVEMQSQNIRSHQNFGLMIGL